jgi:hypothetical protein
MIGIKGITTTGQGREIEFMIDCIKSPRIEIENMKRQLRASFRRSISRPVELTVLGAESYLFPEKEVKREI